MTCSWCGGRVGERARRDSVYCGKRCRQTAFRLRRRRATAGAAGQSIRVAYADPPYPGCARKYYGREEVDHPALIARLIAEWPDGWALSTSAKALRDLLPLCPEAARVCAWVKPNGVSSATNGLHNAWEPLIVVGGRQRPPGVRDWLRAKPARGGGELPGRKPIVYCAWLFDCLGLQVGDTIDDLFPGTRIVTRAWAELGRAEVVLRDASLLEGRHVARVLGDANFEIEPFV